MDELLPCPFCGNPDVAMVADLETRHMDDCECWSQMGESWAINCSAAGTESEPGKGCGATGGYHESKAEAVAKWNRRSLSALPSTTGESK